MLQEADKLDIVIAKDSWELQSLARSVTARIRVDDKIFFQELAERASRCDNLNDVKGLWKEIKRVLPKHATKRTADNPLGDVVLETQWVPYICDLEAGRTAELATIYNDCKVSQEENVWRLEPPTFLLAVKWRTHSVQPNGVDRQAMTRCQLELSPRVRPSWAVMSRSCF